MLCYVTVMLHVMLESGRMADSDHWEAEPGDVRVSGERRALRGLAVKPLGC